MFAKSTEEMHINGHGALAQSCIQHASTERVWIRSGKKVVTNPDGTTRIISTWHSVPRNDEDVYDT